MGRDVQLCTGEFQNLLHWKFVLYSSHYCLFLWLLWSQIRDKFGIPCSCHGAMLCGILAIILCCWIPSRCAIKRMFGFMARQIPFRVITYSAVSQIETLKPGLHDNFLGMVPVWIWPRCLKFGLCLVLWLMLWQSVIIINETSRPFKSL